MSEDKWSEHIGAESSATPWHDIPGLDIETVKDHFDGDLDLFRSVATAFLEYAPPIMAQVKEASDASDFDRLRPVIHKLRGQLGTLGAMPYHNVAQHIEEAASCQRASERDVAELLDKVRELNAQLANWLQASVKASSENALR